MSDRGTYRTVAAMVGTSVIMGSQKSHVTPSWVTMGPENTMPSAAPTASNAEMIPMLPGTRWLGISSRTMPNDRGTRAPASPWGMRAATSTPIEVATPASIVPIASTTSDSSSTRLRPNMSPSRPMIGVATDDERRKPVTSQVVAVSLACRSRWMVVSAGTTSDCCSENPSAIMASTMSVISSRVGRASPDPVAAPRIDGCSAAAPHRM